MSDGAADDRSREALLDGFGRRARNHLRYHRQRFERGLLTEWPGEAGPVDPAAIEIDGAMWPTGDGRPLSQARPVTRADVEQRRRDDPYFDRALSELATAAEMRLDGWQPSLAEIEALAAELREAAGRDADAEGEFWGHEGYGVW